MNHPLLISNRDTSEWNCSASLIQKTRYTDIVFKNATIRELGPGQLDLHWVDLEETGWNSIFPKLCSLLAGDEWDRAGKFRFRQDARRYVLCRSILRSLIEQYAGISAAEVCFSYSERGKPYLPSEQFNLQFNLSHSKDVAIFAFAREEVGIDIENVCVNQVASEAAQVFISPDEARELARMSERERGNAYVQLWVRKEALLKGIGLGLTDGMRDLYVGWSAEPKAVTTVSLPQYGGWSIQNIGRFGEIVGAVAKPLHEDESVDCREFDLNATNLVAAMHGR